MYCPAIVIVTMYFEKRRTFATGIAVCGAGVGTFLFAPLTKWLIDAYTWRGAFLIYAGMYVTTNIVPLPDIPTSKNISTDLKFHNTF